MGNSLPRKDTDLKDKAKVKVKIFLYLYLFYIVCESLWLFYPLKIRAHRERVWVKVSHRTHVT